MNSVCCGCHKDVPSDSAKNILNDDLLIGSSDYVDIAGPIVSTKIIKLSDGIELLTGCKVSKAQNLAVLCTVCCRKMESFMVFRMQLLNAFKKFTSSEPLQCLDYQRKNIIIDKIGGILTDDIPDNYKLLEPKITVDDTGNVNDTNISLELNNSLSDESETNDSLGSNKLPNDQENNNPNDSETSNEIQDSNDSREIFIKIRDNDIESEVDVYSGEDDEVLVLDVQCKKDDVTDAESSPESEAELYDYGPVRKKIKNYNALSPALLF